MVHIDLKDDAAEPGPGEGEHEGEIIDAWEKVSRKGDAYFSVKFCDVLGKPLCYDVIMLQGGGAFMGKAKLKALGFSEDFEGDVQSAELIGRRVMLHLKEGVWNDRKRLEPDKDRGTHFGYTPLSEASGTPTEPLDLDDIPF